MDRSITCSFTGRRPQNLPWGWNENDPRCRALKERLAGQLEMLYYGGYRHFICGMALGCDMYFGEAVLALRQRFSDVSLEAAIPCGDQPDRWSREQRLRYNRLLDHADKVTVLQIHYSSDCMMRRNRYMVDHSSVMLACTDWKPGGTLSTIRYAERCGVTVIPLALTGST